MTISVVIADDHRMFRQGLRSVLENEDGISVVGEAENGSQAVELCTELSPEVVVLDVTMPEMSGIVAAKLLQELGQSAKVIFLSMHMDETYIVEALRSGASGYVLKESAVDELVYAIKVVNEGGTYLSPRVTTLVVAKLSGGGLKGETSIFDILSNREVEILQLLCEGKSGKEIADTLVLSPKTVENHRANIMNKLEIRDIPSLVKFAIRMGLTQP